MYVNGNFSTLRAYVETRWLTAAFDGTSPEMEVSGTSWHFPALISSEWISFYTWVRFANISATPGMRTQQGKVHRTDSTRQRRDATFVQPGGGHATTHHSIS